MHPILFEIPTPWGPLPIYSYGVMLGTSMILGWSIVMYFGKREAYLRDPKANEDFLANAFIVCALSALAGSRVLYMITNPQEFDSIAQFFAFRRGGLVAYGGFLGGFFAAIVWVRQIKGVQLLRFSDGAAHSYPVHPTQIYESLAGFTLFAITLFVWSRRKFHGQVILTLAMAYGLWRFLIEYVRDDPGRGEAFGFSTSQLISLAIIPIAGFAYFQENERFNKKPYKVVRFGDPEPAPPPEAGAAKTDDEDTAKPTEASEASQADTSEGTEAEASSETSTEKSTESRTSGKKKKSKR
jgi:prolipoprotein diacylglyceryltransferase